MKSFLTLVSLVILTNINAQNNVGIGTNSPNNSALLDITSTSKGVLLPRMTKAERIAIVTPADALLVHQTDDTIGLYQFKNGSWSTVADNLGNHKMTKWLVTNNFRIVNYDWQGSGFEIDEDGNTNFYAQRPFPDVDGYPKKNLVIDNVGGIFTYGKLGYGFKPSDLPSDGPLGGPQLMWYPYYASFRAGGTSNKNWTEGKIGFYSAVFGNNNVATGIASFAAGENNRVEGQYSTNFGYNNIVKGNYTFVTGKYNDTTISTTLFAVSNGTSTSARNNALTVLQNGNTGIGVINPEFPLDVNGRVSLRHNGNTAGIWYSNSSNTETVFSGMKTNSQWGVYGNTWQFYFDISNSEAYKNSGSTAWIIASDARLKENIHPYTDGLREIMTIDPVWFNYKKNSGFSTAKPYVGVLAQDLQKTAPYMIGSFNKDGQDLLNVDNSAMTYMLINAVKEQQAEIELLKKENQAIKESIRSLQSANH